MSRIRCWKVLLSACSALLLSAGAHAAIVTLEFTESFGAVPADGGPAWITATFDDGDTPGSVELTITANANIGEADVTQLYFNVDPALHDNLSDFDINLIEEYVNGSLMDAVGVVTILQGADSYRAGGDGYFDILFAIETGDQSMRLNAGESIVFSIEHPGLTASDFLELSEMLTPGEGNPGPFLAAAHIQSTGMDQLGSDWVAAVPLPAAVWLLASSLGMLGFAARRRRRALEQA